MLSGPEKSEVILSEARREYGVRPIGAKIPATLVETGTADGDNFWRIAHHFVEAFTIELDDRPYHDAWQRFLKSPSLTALHGDSSVVLERLVPMLEGPVVFWLDAHYCGGVRGDEDTPVQTELELIFRHRKDERNLVLVDDARLFGSDPAYPTLTWIQDFLDSQGDYMMKVENDIIYIRDWDD